MGPEIEEKMRNYDDKCSERVANYDDKAVHMNLLTKIADLKCMDKFLNGEDVKSGSWSNIENIKDCEWAYRIYTYPIVKEKSQRDICEQNFGL